MKKMCIVFLLFDVKKSLVAMVTELLKIELVEIISSFITVNWLLSHGKGEDTDFIDKHVSFI